MANEEIGILTELDENNKNVEQEDDDDFMEHIWRKYCGKPRPSKFIAKKESMLAVENE